MGIVYLIVYILFKASFTCPEVEADWLIDDPSIGV